MRARVLLPAALLLLAGGAALILALRAGPGEGPGSPGLGSGAVPAADGVAGPVLGGGAQPVAAEAAAPEDSIHPLPADLPPWGFAFDVVRGARRGAMDPAPGATVHVALVGPEGEGELGAWHATTDEEGVCRIGPLTLPPLPRRWVGEAALEVGVEAPEGSPPYSARAPRHALDELAARVRRAPDEDGVRWLSSRLELWAVRRIHGRLLTSSGHPVGGVWVGVKPRTRGFSASPIGWDGAFRIDVPAGEGVLPQLTAHVGGAFEIHELLEIDLPDGDEVLDVRLPGGDEAQGRVTDAEGKGLGGVHLVLARPWWDPNAGFTYSRGGYTPPRWISRMKTLSAADGSFAFAGLVEGEAYVLWWPGDDDQWQRLPDDVILRGDVDLDVVLTRHRFRPVLVDADTGGRVYGQVRLRQGKEDDEPYYPALRAEGSTPEEDGTIAAPGERYRLYAWARGYEVAEAAFTMPNEAGTHEVPIAMQPLAPDRVVRLRFEDGAGAALGPVPVVLVREIPGFWGDLDLRIPLEAEADGWIRLRDLPSGPVYLHGRDRLGRPPSGQWRFVRPFALDLEIPSTGVFERKVACPQGGSVRLFLRLPPDAEPQDMGELHLVHESGAEDSPRWYAPEGDGTWDFEIIGDGGFAPDGRTYESSALPPGAWTLEIEESEAWRAVSVPLRLAPGEITDVRVTLEARD